MEEGAGYVEVDSTQVPRVDSMEVLGTQVTLIGDPEAAVSHRMRKACQSFFSIRPLLRH